MSPPANDAPNPRPARTPAQIIGGDPALSVWVSANAGTGKTQVLTDRIARLLLGGTRPERILCLTFTRAAAAEMATRLSRRLGHWAVADDGELNDDLTALLGAPPPAELLAPARRLFARTLDAPGGLKIRTIHAFCESLLGRFPIEAGIAPHFSVIDERTTTELMIEARDRLFAHAFDPGGDPSEKTDLSESLTLLTGLVNEEDFARLMGELLSARGRLRELFETHGSVTGAIDAARRALGLTATDTADAIIADACDDTAFNINGLKAAAAALAEGTSTDQNRARDLSAFLIAKPHERAQRFEDAYLPLFMTQGGDPRKSLITNKPAVKNPSAKDSLLAEQARLTEVMTRIKAARIGMRSAALIRIGGALMEGFERLKESRALLDYDDLIERAGRLLQSPSHVSWVLYKLDGGLDHILVDEAQDTAPEQWQVIKALAGDFFSGEGRSEAIRTIFAVGDEKQSIYSFQGADPYMFGAVKHHFAERAKDAGRDFRDVELDLSYRSTEAVIEAVNRVFERDAARDGLTFEDKPIRHTWARQGQGGLVEIWPTTKWGETIELDPWDAPLDRSPVNSPEDRLADRIADTIKSWIDNREILLSAARPIHEGDIMVLLRRRGTFAEKMVNALKKRNIPVAGADRMVLTQQLAVMDLMALGHFLLMPDDDLTLAVVLKGPLFGFDDDADLFPLAFGRDGTLWQALQQAAPENKKYQHAHARLTQLLARADYMPPYEFYARLLGPEGGRHALLSRLGLEADDPIDEFLALTLEYERQHVPSLQGFLHWVGAGETQIKRDLELERGEVRVMTVHGSKGLQGNIVFLPDTCTRPGGRGDPKLKWPENPEPALLWPGFKNDEDPICRELSEQARAKIDQEYRRLLYVAMTRARDRLYVAGYETKNQRADGCWYNLIEEALAGGAEQTMDDAGETVLRLTSPQTAAPDGIEKAIPPDDGAAAPLPEWAARPAPSEPEPSRPLAPSRPADEEPAVQSPLSDDDGARFKRGRIIHRLLETLPALDTDARRAAAVAWLARPGHGLTSEEQKAMAEETFRVLEDAAFAPLFGPGSRAEVPLIGEVGGTVLSARIDRLLVTDSAVTIVDFKTNRPPPGDAAHVPETYLRQMAAYRAALSAIYPDKSIICLLLWTDGPDIMILSDALLDAHAPGNTA